MANEFVAYGEIQAKSGTILSGASVTEKDVGGKENFDSLRASGSIVPKFIESVSGEPGAPSEREQELEAKLAEAQAKIQALEADKAKTEQGQKPPTK